MQVFVSVSADWCRSLSHKNAVSHTTWHHQSHYTEPGLTNPALTLLFDAWQTADKNTSFKDFVSAGRGLNPRTSSRQAGALITRSRLW